MADAQRRRLTVGQNPLGPSGKSVGGVAEILGELLRADPKYEHVSSIHSVTDTDGKKTRSFGEKNKGHLKDKTVGVESKYTTDVPVAPVPKMDNVFFTCNKGLKPESPNQDSFMCAVNPKKWGLYGVFDGHGPNGHDVSDFAVKKLVMKFLAEANFEGNPGPAFTKAFTQCQVDIEAAKSDGLDASSSGSTCTMVFHNIETDKLCIAHVGDSRAVLYDGKTVGKLKVVHETEDHKPNLPGEKARIEKMGGRVVFDGYYNYRVFAKAGMYPGLNMSRALGDVVAHKEAGLTAEPELKEIDLAPLREKSEQLTLVIASDGVWEFIKSEDAPNFLCTKDSKALDVNPDTVKALAKKSWDSWMEDSDNEISDDISVVAVLL